MLKELKNKEADIEGMAERALKNDRLLSELIDGLIVRNETYRYNCYKVLYSISKSYPAVLYPSWDAFAEALTQANQSTQP